MIFVSLTVYVFCQSPAATWTNPYFYYHYNAPLAMAPQKISPYQMASNQNVFSGHDDQSLENTLGSHVVMLSTCLRELKSKSQIILSKTFKSNCANLNFQQREPIWYRQRIAWIKHTQPSKTSRMN
jgi:hypothetical protein